MLKIALKWFYGFLRSCFQASSLPVRHYKKKSKEYCKLQASSAVAFEFGPASLVVPDASSPAVVSAAALKKSRYLYCCSPQVVFSALLAVQPLDQEVVEDGGPDSPCFLTWDDRDLLLPQYP